MPESWIQILIFGEVSKPEIETWLKDELGIKNRLQQTQQALQSIARKVPDIPDFISRADQAFDLIVKNNEEDKTPKNSASNSYVIGGLALIVGIMLAFVFI